MVGSEMMRRLSPKQHECRTNALTITPNIHLDPRIYRRDPVQALSAPVRGQQKGGNRSRSEFFGTGVNHAFSLRRPTGGGTRNHFEGVGCRTSHTGVRVIQSDQNRRHDNGRFVGKTLQRHQTSTACRHGLVAECTYQLRDYCGWHPSQNLYGIELNFPIRILPQPVQQSRRDALSLRCPELHQSAHCVSAQLRTAIG